MIVGENYAQEALDEAVYFRCPCDVALERGVLCGFKRFPVPRRAWKNCSGSILLQNVHRSAHGLCAEVQRRRVLHSELRLRLRALRRASLSVSTLIRQKRSVAAQSRAQQSLQQRRPPEGGLSSFAWLRSGPRSGCVKRCVVAATISHEANAGKTQDQHRPGGRLGNGRDAIIEACYETLVPIVWKCREP